MSISTTFFGEISHASLFFTGQLRNPWQMLAEPWGSAEPRLKNTDSENRDKIIRRLYFLYCNFYFRAIYA